MPVAAPIRESRPAVRPHEELTHPLHRLRAGIRRFVAFDILLFAAVFGVFVFWIGVGFDFGLFKLAGLDIAQQSHWGLRAAAMAIVALVFGLMLFVRLRSLLTKELSYPALALVLEKRHPELLGDRLITAVELADLDRAEGQGYSREMIGQTVAEARERVGRISVGKVFRWRRLWFKGLLVAAVMLLGVGTAVAIDVGTLRAFQPVPLAHKLADVVTIWGERNVLLRNTPWPRRAHLELAGFPESGELRLGKEAGAPQIKARAYRWVIAAPGTYDGWRPLAWSDLANPKFAIAAPTTATISEAGVVRDLDLAGLTVDEVELRAGASNPALVDTFAKLDALTADPWMSRTVRKLILPKDLKLAWVGASGKNRNDDTNLGRQPNGDYTGEVIGLNENLVSFQVGGEDFRTPSKAIRLIPKPVLVELKRDEYAPAYLYHAPPRDVPPELGVDGQAALRGLRQKFPDKRMAISGERSIFSVPVGSELDITATADKKLKRVAVAAKTGKVPDFVREAASEAEGFETFTVPFRGPHTILEQTEFTYTLTDFDDVSATVAVTIQVADDQPPQVDLYVDVLRLVGNAYMVTPSALVPFTNASYVKDDTGLSNVEFAFSYVQLESEVVQKLQASMAAALSNAFGSPLPNWGNPALMFWNSNLYRDRIGKRDEKKTFRSAPVMRFKDDHSALPRETHARLLQKVNEPLRSDQSDTVRQVRFPEAWGDGFDLRLHAPNLLVKEASLLQPRYRVELNVVATDVNAELVGKNDEKIVGKTGQNIAPIQLLVVSEQELLIEISKDEEQQRVVLEDLYKRVVDVQGKLTQEIGFLRSPTKDQIENTRIRTLDITQDVLKSKDQLASVLVVYERLHREFEFNRCSPALLERYKRDNGLGIIDRIKRLLDGTEEKGNFPAAENGLRGFQTPLNGGAAPDDVVTNIARNELAKLIAALDDLLRETKRAEDRAKLVADLMNIIKAQTLLGINLKDIADDIRNKLRIPSIQPAKPVAVAVGKKVAIKHGIDFKLYDKPEVEVLIEVPAQSELQAPSSIKVKDDQADFSFDLTAGAKPGTYILKLKPKVGEDKFGEEVEIQVTVTQ